MKLAALQTDIAWEDPQANFERLRPQIAAAAAAGARMVVLPEIGFNERSLTELGQVSLVTKENEDRELEWASQLLEDYGISGKDSYLRMSADPAFRVRVYQMVRAMTARHVAGAEYPKDRLFPAF